MGELNFISGIHRSTQRNYLERVTGANKAECSLVAKKFGEDYFDGDRKYGYGGFRYDGRWKAFAQQLITQYDLRPGMRVLDIGCAKGFLLHELRALVPEMEVAGLDVSEYAISHAMDSVKGFLSVGNAVELDFADRYFDLVLSINTLHNLRLPGLFAALREMERVGRGAKFIVVDSYRNERERMNLLYWQLTCECFFSPEEWEWIFQQTGYTGDWDFVCFE
jgi:ubiquinone/menaquinone biosynthesis C-methylase UbiE